MTKFLLVIITLIVSTAYATKAHDSVDSVYSGLDLNIVRKFSGNMSAAIGLLQSSYDPGRDVPNNGKGADYIAQLGYLSAIELVSREKSSEACSVLLNSLKANEAYLKKFEKNGTGLDPQGDQRVVDMRSHLVIALGQNGVACNGAIEKLKAISQEPKNPFGIYDMYDGFFAQKSAKDALVILEVAKRNGK